jgi:hypothetical protein
MSVTIETMENELGRRRQRLAMSQEAYNHTNEQLNQYAANIKEHHSAIRELENAMRYLKMNNL